MRCAACTHELIEKKGEIDLRVNGKLYIVQNVSYEECPFCGEKVFSPEISEVLYQKIEHGEFVEQTIQVPVLDGTYG